MTTSSSRLAKFSMIGLLALGGILPATATFAQGRYGYGRVVAPPYFGESWQGDIIARRTAEAQNEPGVTRELSPDSRQTATGGPVGGVPGFEGGL